MEGKEKFDILPNDLNSIKKFIKERSWVKIKVNDQLPDVEVFQLISGDPV
jgi:uncharacterized membrane-anchored protein